MNFVKKILDNINNYKKENRDINKLLEQNDNFLISLKYEEKIKLFEHIKSYVNITYSDKKFYHPDISYFFNDFFSKYETIIIDEFETYLISSKYLYIINPNSTDNTLIIGKDMADMVYIKKNDNLNNIFIETLDLEEEITNNNPSYSSLYDFLLDHIGHVYKIKLEDKYNEIK